MSAYARKNYPAVEIHPKAMFTLYRIAFRADTNEHLSDMTLHFRDRRGQALLVTEIAPKSPFLSANRSPLRYCLGAGAKAIRYTGFVHFFWRKIQARFKDFHGPHFQGPNSPHRFQVNYIKSSNNNGLLFLRATIFMRIRLWVLFKESSYVINNTIIVTMFLIKLYLTTWRNIFVNVAKLRK